MTWHIAVHVMGERFDWEYFFAFLSRGRRVAVPPSCDWPINCSPLKSSDQYMEAGYTEYMRKPGSVDHKQEVQNNAITVNNIL